MAPADTEPGARRDSTTVCTRPSSETAIERFSFIFTTAEFANGQYSDVKPRTFLLRPFGLAYKTIYFPNYQRWYIETSTEQGSVIYTFSNVSSFP